MREDMFKVIVERPRAGRSWASKSKLRYAPADAPPRMTGKRIVTQTTGGTKYLNENLAPLRRYLFAQRGRRWDDVFSDICAHLDTSSTVKMHVREHIDDFIERKVRREPDGSWRATGSWGSPTKPSHWADLYVDPTDGRIKETRLLCQKLGVPTRRNYWASQRQRSKRCAKLRRISDRVFIIQKDGIWYQYELTKPAFTPGGYGYGDREIYGELCKATWQCEGPWQLAAKRQLSKKQLKAHGLKNTWEASMSDINVTLIISDESWIEGDAVRQLEITARLPGISAAAGLPDLHPGKGIPVGAAFQSNGVIYPHLVGNDIGCGMGLWGTGLPARKFKLDKNFKKLTGFEQVWDGDAAARLEAAGLPPNLWPYALGTIGSGNHFAEFQKIDTVFDPAALNALNMNASHVHLLVHSGSRGLGEEILRRHVDRFKGGGLTQGTAEFDDYLNRHNDAMRWAEVNRAVIAERFLGALGLSGDCHLDITHNSVTPYGDAWLHRKGAAPADKGAVVIPGSRGTLNYLVKPVTEKAGLALHSLAHGAGRKWKRSDAKGRLSKRYSVSDLTRTPLGGRVICEDKALIYEEAPEAYKDISTVISDMERFGLITVIATLRPLITYKTRRR